MPTAADGVLRWGGGRTDYDPQSIALCEQALREAGLPEHVVIDCSHRNSNENPALQPLVAENGVNPILEGDHLIVGLMLESHLHAGSQPVPEGRTGSR